MICIRLADNSAIVWAASYIDAADSTCKPCLGLTLKIDASWFQWLYGLVRDRLSCEPRSGHLFLFCNAQRNRLKVLVWDGSGLWVCANSSLVQLPLAKMTGDELGGQVALIPPSVRHRCMN